MGSSDLYKIVKALALEKRAKFGVNKDNIGLAKLREIYKIEGIKIHLKDEGLKTIRAAYFNDQNGCDVLLNSSLPKEVRIFSLAHELKHHYLDRDILKSEILTMEYGAEPLIEKTAEVFAAQFVWPEDDFYTEADNFGLCSSCSPEDIVNFKRYSNMPVSYKFVTKRLEWFNIIQKGSIDKEHFQILEWKMYGKPFYLQNKAKKKS